MKTKSKKVNYLTKNWPYLDAAGIGGIFCLFCDYFVKNQTSLVNSIIQIMNVELQMSNLASFLIIAKPRH